MTNPAEPMTDTADGLVRVLEAIKASLQAKFPLCHVDLFNPASPDEQGNNSGDLQTPAILINLEQMPATGDNDDRDSIQGRFALHCILGNETPNLAIEIRAMSAAVLSHVRKNGSWLPGQRMTDPPTDIYAIPGYFSSRPNTGYDSWMVLFEQVLHLGPSHWDGSTARPQRVFVARSTDGTTEPKQEHEQAI